MKPIEAGKLLVVDDSPTAAAVVSRALRTHGWQVSFVSSGAAACAAVKEDPPEVVVCDLHMPDMDGYAVLNRLAEIDATLPVIVLSADRDLSAVLSAVRHGAFDYVIKSPHQMDALVAAVARAAAHCRVLRDNARLTAELATRLVDLEREVSERQAAQRDLRVARDQAMAANRAKSAFLANMSHELRTPLNAVLGYADLLEEDLAHENSDAQAADARRIRDAGTHLLSLINDILDLAKIESGGAQVFCEAIAIGDLVDQLVVTATPLARDHRNRLILDCAADLGSMYGDLRKTRQIVLNLLGNACKFTEDGDIRLSVGRVVEDDREWIVFQVEDTGIGMSEDVRSRIFDPFAQADPSATRKHGGTGLGLAITRQLSELLGGRIAVDSQLGIGSTFRVHIPAALPETGERGDSTDHRVPSGATTILVIDDDDDMRALVTRYLADADLDVVCATSGAEGIAKAIELSPAVICLDVVMPDVDGYDVLRALKANPDIADTPVVLVTMVDDRERGFALGAADYLMKPVGREQLIDTLARLADNENTGPALVVDDSPTNREILGRMLESEGWEWNTAANGREALASIEDRRPSVILLDLMMPEMDGYGVIGALQRNPAWWSIPVVVVTGARIPPAHRSMLQKRVEAVVEREGADTADVLLRVRQLVEGILSPSARKRPPATTSPGVVRTLSPG